MPAPHHLRLIWLVHLSNTASNTSSRPSRLAIVSFLSLWWKLHVHCSMIWSDVRSLVRYWAWVLCYWYHAVSEGKPINTMPFFGHQLTPCLEAPSWWTNDDCYVSEASKNHVFVYKRFLSSSLWQHTFPVAVILHVCCQQMISLYKQCKLRIQ